MLRCGLEYMDAEAEYHQTQHSNEHYATPNAECPNWAANQGPRSPHPLKRRLPHDGCSQ